MKRYIISALMLAVAVSCTVKELNSVIETASPEITASVETNTTKTTLTTDEEGVGTIWWEPADEINVFYGTASTHYVSKNKENATTTTFSTTDVIGSTESEGNNIWGLYPYEEEAECDGEYVTTTIPASQKGVEGTFDDDLFTALAHSESTTMKFYNVLGGIKVSLSRDDIQSITFNGKNNEDLVGKVKLTMGEDERPVAAVVEGVKSITLTPKEGTTFKKNTNYYIVLLPTVLSKGFTMTFDAGTEIGTFEYKEKSVEIRRAVFSKKENIDSYAEFEEKEIKALKFTADGEQSISLNNVNGNAPSLQYSYDGIKWSDWDYSPLPFGTYNKECVYIRGNNPNGFSKDRQKYSSFSFSTDDKVQCNGNIMHLLSYTENSTAIPNAYCFYSLFYRCTSLVFAPKLPATTLADCCYYGMFRGCTSLVSAPELPATTLADYCYRSMFYKCTSLVSAPKLPATTLAEECYGWMFNGCTSLISAPELPATTLVSGCYSGMFYGCTSLVSAPELPATTLAYDCYGSMFYKCTSLVSAPKLPATTLAEECYGWMFNGCTSLISAPKLPATTLAYECYRSMFSGCTSLISAPELPATTLTADCYSWMFNGCSKLNYVKALFTTTPSDGYTYSWLSGVSPTGTFVKSKDATWDVIGDNGIPNGWTVQTE